MEASPEVASTSTVPPVTSSKLEEIRSMCGELVERDDVSKQSALQIMNVFHGMENLLREECVQRDKVITSQRFELERTREPTPSPHTDSARRKKW